MRLLRRVLVALLRAQLLQQYCGSLNQVKPLPNQADGATSKPSNNWEKMTNVGISGLGAVGSQLLQRLQYRNDINKVVIYDSDYSKLGKHSRKNSQKIQIASSPKMDQGDIEILFLCTPSGQHLEYAHRALRQGISIISVSDRISDVIRM